MPPKPPSQAGRFKPVKRPVKKPDAAPSSSAGSGGNNRGRDAQGGRDSTGGARDGRGGRGDRSRSPGRGRGDGRGREGGRGGRGGRDGRGRGRGGRFIIPTGAAFFTGASVKTEGAADAAGLLSGSGGVSEATAKLKIEAGKDGAVMMPGANMSASSGSQSAGTGKVARNVAESMAAAARAKMGEGEEIIVAEMDVDETDDGKKKSVLEAPSRAERFDGLPSMFDNEDENETSGNMADAAIAEAFVYDSDSSEEERKLKRKQRSEGGRMDSSNIMIPAQLPFPVAPHQQTMYECQKKTAPRLKQEEEKKMAEADATPSSNAAASSNLSDPPLESPFLDLNSVSEELKRIETNSWFLMKFPTRLPHLDTSSSSNSNHARAAHTDDTHIKSEFHDEDGEVDNLGPSPGAIAEHDVTGDSSSAQVGGSQGGAVGIASSSSSGPLGYDDTLKDIAPGKYGKIIVYKSGRTELVVGGDGTGPEVRLLIHEGLQCGFRQEAVSIDPEESNFVPLGVVNKSLIVTPDVERAFSSS